MRIGRALVALVVALGVLLAVVGLGVGAGAREAPSGLLGDVAVRDLPSEAQRTLALIRAGGPFPYRKDGTVFANRERVLPRQARGHYTEYTVATPGARDRGARRIVAGGDPRSSGEYWYTDDHYQSFRRIRE